MGKLSEGRNYLYTTFIMLFGNLHSYHFRLIQLCVSKIQYIIIHAYKLQESVLTWKNVLLIIMHTLFLAIAFDLKLQPFLTIWTDFLHLLFVLFCCEQEDLSSFLNTNCLWRLNYIIPYFYSSIYPSMRYPRLFLLTKVRMLRCHACTLETGFQIQVLSEH